jgi:PAS domain S-box-containing protein
VGIFILLILLAVNSYVTYKAIRRVAKNNAQLSHTQRLLFQIEGLENLLVDAETGQRGYLYTGDSRYLEPYNRTASLVDGQIDRLAGLTAGNSRDGDWITQLRSLSHVKLDELAQTIALTQQQKAGEAMAIVRSNLGKNTMDQIRQIISQIKADEIHEQEVRTALTAESTKAAGYTFTVATGVACLGLLLFGGSLASERKKLEAAARAVSEQKEWLNTTLHSIGDAVIATDASGHVVFLNQVAASLTGFTSAEAKGLPLREVFPIFNENTRLPAEDPVEKVIRLGTIVGLANHTILRRRDGTSLFIDDSAAPIKNQDGELIGVVMVFRDITQQRTVETSLSNAEKLATAGRFAATIAHEINNPLEAVMNSLFLLTHETGLSTEGKRYLLVAEQELIRVAAVARQTLAFYKDRSTPAPVEIPKLLEEVLSLYSRRIETRNIRIVREYEEPASCIASAGELRQVFSNLILNSIDALRSDAVLTLRVGHDRLQGVPQLRVEIQDNGEGIPPENIERIFEPFFTTKKDVGTGLGLWSARNLVEKHGGHVVASSANGTTTFTVWLPLSAEVQADNQVRAKSMGEA